MKNYRIVASDLDGTLLNNRAEVSSENLEAIKKLSEKDIYFVPATGRTFAEIPAELRNNPDIRYYIYSNGAVVYDKQTKNKILNCISNNIRREILDVLYSCDSHITFRHDGQCFVDALSQSEEDFEHYNIIEAHRVVVRDYAVYLDDFKKKSYLLDNVEVFSAFFHNMDEKNACKNYFEKMGNLRVVEAAEYNLEIININAGKGNALHTLADLLDVNYSDTISIGDSDNDSGITISAGLGLAVSNACDSLKKTADEIICSNEEHVVHYILSHYFNG